MAEWRRLAFACCVIYLTVVELLALAYFGGFCSLVPIFLFTLPSSYGFLWWADSEWGISRVPIRWYFVWAAVMNTSLFYAAIAAWARVQIPLLAAARKRWKWKWLRPKGEGNYEPIGGTGNEPLEFKKGNLPTFKGRHTPLPPPDKSQRPGRFF